jgi:hypothetical protein
LTDEKRCRSQLANCLFSESLEIQTNKSRRIVFEDIY